MRLRETNPAEFETYVQMAADAAKLAKEQPEVFKAMLQDREPRAMAQPGAGENKLSPGICCTVKADFLSGLVLMHW